MVDEKALYLGLMKRCLVNLIYSDYEYSEAKGFLFQKILAPLCVKRSAKIIIPYAYDENKRREGKDWSPIAHTMIGFNRLDNIQYCVEEVIKNKIPGDLIETGVWRGGAAIFMRAILKIYGITDRKVWVADSFEGLPRPDEKTYPHDKGDKHYTYKELAVSLERVKSNFQKYGLLDEQVTFLKGWFKDTLSCAPIQKLAVARLDGDMYESTTDALKNLYHKLSPGGFLIIDDYGTAAGCKAAVYDFRKEHAITEEIILIDWAGAYWQKMH